MARTDGGRRPVKINFVSLFSGIEAASVAMSRIPDAEWSPVFFSEIDPYANALLAHRFPTVPNLGDICKIRADIKKGTITNGRTTLPFPDGGIHLLCGGSPCQDVSTAGLRRGMEENSATRSSLAFEYLRLVDELRPRCILWENVAGVLSSRRGLDFRDFLRRLVELGFGVAWRVLDCQYTRSDSFPRAIPQRRRRVFLLGLRTDGHSGDDAVRSAEILLERNGVLGNPPTEREEGQALAAPAGYGPLRANRDVAEGFGESGHGYWLGGGSPRPCAPVTGLPSPRKSPSTPTRSLEETTPTGGRVAP
jgi:DNA (cytosine-5)-methyltransferase 1